ncbi:MAG: hypothetical protein VSS75_013955 [Candidatus Parabeggiatoa sp.]|nr:hypothetical protein [Candidatus Parabeggiatoa sp.]
MIKMKEIISAVMMLILTACVSLPPIPEHQPTPQGGGSFADSNYGIIPFSEEVSSDLDIGKNVSAYFSEEVLQKQGLTTMLIQQAAPIGYQTAESPEVTIEPVTEDTIRQQLQALSAKNNLTGLIFGHIMQDLVKDVVYVIARVYLTTNPGQYQTFGQDEAMSIKVAAVKPKLIKERLAQVGQEIKQWLSSQVQPPVQPQQTQQPSLTPPQATEDIVDQLGGSQAPIERQSPNTQEDIVDKLEGSYIQSPDDVVDSLGGEFK